MASIEQYSGDVIPHLLMGTSGTAGDLIYLSTGSGMTHKSNSDSGTDNTEAFIGALINTTTAGSYGAVNCRQVVQLEKLASTNKIEMGDIVYADGAASDNKVGTLAGGTAIGVAVEQSATTESFVSVRLIPCFEMGVSGFNA